MVTQTRVIQQLHPRKRHVAGRRAQRYSTNICSVFDDNPATDFIVRIRILRIRKPTTCTVAPAVTIAEKSFCVSLCHTTSHKNVHAAIISAQAFLYSP